MWESVGLAREVRGRYWWRVERVGRVGERGNWRMEARVMQFMAVLCWVLLGIGYSVFLCLFFGS